MSITTNEGKELRDAAEQLGRMLLWHAKHTPLSTWEAVANKGLTRNSVQPWELSGLLHKLNEYRPKREPTPEELRAIKRLLRINGMPMEALEIEAIGKDPEWALFELALHSTSNLSPSAIQTAHFEDVKNMSERYYRLNYMLTEWGEDGLRKHFAVRLRDGESFNGICESWLLPYRRTAEILGWNYKKKKFGNPYQRQEPALPTRPVVAFQRPRLRLVDAHGDDDNLAI